MNHADVISQGLAEKYFLRELTAEQHEAFELHCFECVQCAAELKTLYAVKESVRRMPATLVNGSAVGIYGDRGDEPLTEESAPGGSDADGLESPEPGLAL